MSVPLSLPQFSCKNNSPEHIQLTGCWTLATMAEITACLKQAPANIQQLDARTIEQLDSAGTMQLIQFMDHVQINRNALQLKEEHRALVQTIEGIDNAPQPNPKNKSLLDIVAQLGQLIYQIIQDIMRVVAFFGENLIKTFSLLIKPKRLRLTATVFHMQQIGFQAIPLVALLSFLVGAVIAFLGAAILRDFGAEIFVVELVSIAFLREFAVLLTAIVLAGRTASAFTAQIGAMKAGEEIDAMKTLGMDPTYLLVIPRLIALIIMLPILTFIAMLAGLLGGLTVGAINLDIPPLMYYVRLYETMELRHFFVGLSKAPIFAIIIGLIGCLEGLRAQGTAQSVGEHTTSSVVQSIALVIILDALGALWFMQVGW